MLRLDGLVLSLLNRPGGPWLDRAMVLASNRLLLICWVLAAALFVALRTDKRLVGAALLLVSAGLAEAVGAGMIKPAAARTRPCASQVSVAIHGCDAGGSMPSDHASITAAVAVALVWAAPAAGAIAVPVALWVGVSRVYLGVHYPSDVLAGYVLGVALTIALLAISRRFRVSARLRRCRRPVSRARRRWSSPAAPPALP